MVQSVREPVEGDQLALKALYERVFQIYALSRARGHAFGSSPPVAGYASDDGLSFGAVLRDEADGRFGFMCMRRRVDDVWAAIEEDGGIRDFDQTTAALSRAIRDGGPREPLPPGIRSRAPLHKLGPKGASAVFNMLRRRDHQGAAWALNQVYLALPDPDPNWTTDCQTSNFHTRLFEAYLLACFREQGRLVLQNHASPDFEISNLAGQSAWIEAVTANAAAYDHVGAAPLPAPADPVERQTGVAAERFAKTLRSKLQRGYDQLAHVAGKPFAIAIADFHAPSSMTWTREALPAYLYGKHAVVAERDGVRVAVERPNPVLLGAAAIAAGLFCDQKYSGLAAVLFTNAATIAKFNRMGFLAGAGRDQGVRITRTGILFDRTPGALEPIDFDLDGTPDAAPISEDWLNVFEGEAAQMSSEQMQRLFGKILAGEIRRPSSYSIKTVKLMAQLDNQAANLFRLLCSLSVSIRVPNSSIIIDARVVSMGNAAQNALQAYGLGFDALNVLHEYGLIISDYNSYMDYRATAVHRLRIGLPMTYQNAQWALLPKAPPAELQTPAELPELRVNGVALSRTGKELLSIVDIEPNEAYTAALKNFFDQHGMSMTNIVVGN